MTRDRVIKIDHWVHGEQAVVKLQVDAIVPYDDPSEPCFEPATMNFLREVRERADAGEIAWLQRVGKVYASVPATASA